MGVSFEEPEVVSEGRKDVKRVPCKFCEQQLADCGGTTNLYRSLVPRPFLCGRGERKEGRKGLVNNSTLTRIHGCIPAVSVDEGKRECQVGVSRE